MNPKMSRDEYYEKIEKKELSLVEIEIVGRQVLGLSQTELAKLIGISRKSLYTFEQDPSNCSVKTLKKILGFFGVELSYKLES